MIIKITSKQIKAITFMASGESITNTAKNLGISRVTIHDWLNNDSHFVAHFNKIKTEQLEAVRVELQAVSSLAVKTLVNVMQKSTNDIAKINVAKEILSMTGFTKDADSQYGLGIGSTTPKEVEADKEAKKINDELMAELSGVY